MISKPVLGIPPAGYVEVEVDGTRVWKNVTTGEIYGSEQVSAEEQLRADVDYIAVMTGVTL